MNPIDIDAPVPLLGGLSPRRFMQQHWQKKPLWVRQAWPGVAPPLARAALFDLAAQDGIESRLVTCTASGRWEVRRGPLPRRTLPPVSRPGWTLLVQGLDLQVPAARAMLDVLRFLPDARVDDLMVSWASPGGGVGPHLDDYDVFLLQVQGRRRWRIGPVTRPQWVLDAPLKRLAQFHPTEDQVLEPGDLLYLPPGWGHDGIAEGGDCMTCSAGFRVPRAGDLARELLARLAEEGGAAGALYRDARQPATATPAAIPEGMLAFARRALARELAQPLWLERTLGEWLTEPKAQVWFDAPGAAAPAGGLRLSARTRMLYDAQHVFINGEAFRTSGRDAQAMRRLADLRVLAAAERQRLSTAAAALVDDWLAAGWLLPDDPAQDPPPR